jgi:hypothetical protein
MINGGYINDAQVNGFYAADEEAYQLWLRDPSAAEGHIVELDYAQSKDGSNVPTVGTILLTGFPLAGYHERIKSLPSFTRQIAEDFSGSVSASIGSLELSNGDGGIDSWLTLAIDGWGIRVKHGAPSWLPERFRTINEGVSEIVESADESAMSIRLRAIDYGSNVEMQSNLVASGPNIGQPIPLTYGRVFNVEPVVIDGPNSTYQWHDGAVNVVENVRDSGIDFQTAFVSVTAFSGDSFICGAVHGFVLNTRVVHITTGGTNVGSGEYWVIASGLTTDHYQVSTTRGGSVFTPTGLPVGMSAIGYHWTATLSDGKLLLDSTPAGQLTLDGSGTFDNAETVMEAILNADRIDKANAARFFALSADFLIGVYVRERSNVLDIADMIMRGIGCWYGRNRLGMLQFGSIVLAPTYEYLDLTADLILGPITLDRMIVPRSMPALGYRHNWTIQSTGLAAGVTDDNRALYSGPYSIKKAGAPPANSIQSHLLATTPPVIDSMLWDGDDTLAALTRVINLYNGWGAVFNVVVGRVGYSCDIGQTVNITYPRYGFNAGVLSQIVSIDDQPTAGRVELKVYVFLGTTWPGQL